MKFSIEWLQEFVEIKIGAEALAEKLTMAGFECEGIEAVGATVSGVVTGKITEIKKHPDADKLVITQIDVGTETVQIVTGATNIKEGDIVPASLPGAVLEGGLKIKVSKLRGIDSYGMLCSQVELGMAEESAGIWILPSDTPIGVDIVEWAKIKDTILDLSILPNRGDCQSIVGLAREISVILKEPMKWAKHELSEDKGLEKPNVDIKHIEGCTFYSARRLASVKQTETPVWMQRRLIVMGIRPISMAVDITNYVMLELGQPLHAFDATKVSGNSLTVRMSGDKEPCETLDGQKRVLPSDTLVITDTTQILAMAGVMGGKNSEVAATTSDIILESATFDKTIVRRKALESGLRTESSLRFEKGIPSVMAKAASERAAALYVELCGATVSSLSTAGDALEPSLWIPFDLDKINQFLGSTFTIAESLDVLTSLGFKLENGRVSVPIWRQGDVQGWQDIAEEIVRILGYDRIEARLPKNAVAISIPTSKQTCITTLRQACRSLGLDNVVNFPMISPKDLDLIGAPLIPNLQVDNPLTVEESVMRPQLLPSLLKVAYHNQNRQVSNIRIMEIGRVFIDHDQELEQCAGLLEGDVYLNAYRATDRKKISDFAQLRGLVEQLVQHCGVQNGDIQPIDDQRFHPKKSAELIVDGKIVGRFGVLHPFLCENAGLNREFAYFELSIDRLAELSPSDYSFKAFSKFPASDKDVAFVVPKNMSFKTVFDAAKKFQPKRCVNLQFFDYFESEELGDNVSMALRLRFQDLNETLSDEFVNKAHQKFMDKMTQELGITIR